MPSAALVPPILTGTDNVSGNFLRSATRLESAGGLDGPTAPKHRLLSQHCNRRFAELTAGSAPVFEELADADDLFAAPGHPYTRMLVDTIPKLDTTVRDREPMAGEVPTPSTHPRDVTSTPAVQWPTSAASASYRS